MRNIELLKIRTIRGGYVYVDRHELESERVLLRMYNKHGLRIQGDFTSIHRDNLDPDGSKTAEINKGISILGSALNGYACATAVRREIARLKQNPDDYDVYCYKGRWFGHLKSEGMPAKLGIPL
jgi:hypothetical protein